MVEPVVYGSNESVYVQALRLTLWAKQVSYVFVEVDPWSVGQEPEHLARHPFGKVPAFQHADLRLYETAPCCRYVDEAFAGVALQPSTAAGRAVMAQAVSILDNYAYRSLVWGLYVVQVEGPGQGRLPDLGRIQRARSTAETCLAALDALAPGAAWLASEHITLADLHAAPMFNLFSRSPEAEALMSRHKRICGWWAKVQCFVSGAHIIGP